MDHDGYGCPNPKVHHVPSVTRAMAHTVPRASMKAQHKTLPDGTGAGMGWILSESINKATYVREGKGGTQKYSDSFIGPPKWKKSGKGNGKQQMRRGGSDEYLRKNKCDQLQLYHRHPPYNICSHTCSTSNQPQNIHDDVTIVTSNKKAKKSQLAFNIGAIAIKQNHGVADAGATGHF